MDAREAGFGYVVPIPGAFGSHLADIVYIDEQGALQTTGNLFDDAHFKKLMDGSSDTRDNSHALEKHTFRTVAFTTGCVDVKPLSEEELAG